MSEIASHYAGKAERYARFRWDYAPAAIAQIVDLAGLRPGDAVADIGAGPGTLSRWLLTHKLRVWAVEPEAEMRGAAEALLGGHANFHSVATTAEGTGLPAASLRLITVGRALHWFTPRLAQREFSRILHPDGWLAILAVRCTDPTLEAAVKGLMSERTGFDLNRNKQRRPAVDVGIYLRPEGRVELHAPAVKQERWPEFIGRLSTFSGAPDPDTLGFALLEQAARPVFERFAVDDILTVPVETQVWMGHMWPSDSTCQGEPDQ